MRSLSLASLLAVSALSACAPIEPTDSPSDTPNARSPAPLPVLNGNTRRGALATARAQLPASEVQLRAVQILGTTAWWLIGRAPEGFDVVTVTVVYRDGSSPYGSETNDLSRTLDEQRRFAIKGDLASGRSGQVQFIRVAFTNAQRTAVRDTIIEPELAPMVADGAPCDIAGALSRCAPRSVCVGAFTGVPGPGSYTGRCEPVAARATAFDAMIDDAGRVSTTAQFTGVQRTTHVRWRVRRAGLEISPWLSATPRGWTRDNAARYLDTTLVEGAQPGDTVEWTTSTDPAPNGPGETVSGPIVSVTSSRMTHALGDRCVTTQASTCGIGMYCDGDSLLGTCRSQSAECSELSVVPISLALPAIGESVDVPIPQEANGQECVLLCVGRTRIVTSVRIVAPPSGATIEISGPSSVWGGLATRCVNINFSEAECPTSSPGQPDSTERYSVIARLGPNEVRYLQIAEFARDVRVRRTQ